MPEQWHGKIRYEHLILDNEATAWTVYEGSGEWKGVVRSSRNLPDCVDGFLFHCRDGRRLRVNVVERTQDGGRSVMKVSASPREVPRSA
jgi:hypothetical protein